MWKVKNLVHKSSVHVYRLAHIEQVQLITPPSIFCPQYCFLIKKNVSEFYSLLRNGEFLTETFAFTFFIRVLNLPFFGIKEIKISQTLIKIKQRTYSTLLNRCRTPTLTEDENTKKRSIREPRVWQPGWLRLRSRVGRICVRFGLVSCFRPFVFSWFVFCSW